MAGIFNEAVLTKKGIELLAKAQAADGKITLTKAVTGAGTHGKEDLSDSTALKDQRQEFPLQTVTVQNKTNVFVKFIITNHPDSGDLTEGYYVKEIGIYAKGSDQQEVLYAIATAIEGQEDYMPSYNSLLPSTITIEFLTEVANAESVTITMPNKSHLYDEATGTKYDIGVENGLLYIQEVEE